MIEYPKFTVASVNKAISLMMIEYGIPLTSVCRTLCIRAYRDEWGNSEDPDKTLMLSILDQMLIENESIAEPNWLH